MGTPVTFIEIKDYFMGTIERKPSGKVPAGAQQNVWMCMMAAPCDHYNEVFPSIYLGDRNIVKDIGRLKSLGITHVVNCACGKKFNMIDTDEQFYQESGIKFHGISATDIMTFKMAPYFSAAADFIDDALKSGGKVYVHCVSGVSRSASIVLAFLMIKRGSPLKEAAKMVRDKRKILPNDGFMRELVQLNNNIYSKT